MRGLLVILSAVVLAQAQSAAPKSAAAAKPKPAAVKSAAAKAKPAPAKAIKPAATAAKPASGNAARPAAQPAPAALATDDEKIIYSLGLSIYRTLAQFDLSPGEVALVQRAIGDAAAGKPAVNLDEWGEKIQPFARARVARATANRKAASQAYIEKAAAEPGAERTLSGIVYREITRGTGASPTAADTVTVNYRGTLIDGTEFDSSYKRNEPAKFGLKSVIPCWTEGVQKMKVGGKSVLVCPSDLAYGDRNQPGIPGGSALVFEIELLSIEARPAAMPAAPAPAPVAAPAPGK